MKCKDCNYDCGRRGEGETECFYEVEMKMQKEAEEAPYWRKFRAEAAKDLMFLVLGKAISKGELSAIKQYPELIHECIVISDELIKQLKEKEEK